MPLKWSSDFDVEIPNRSPRDVEYVCLRGGWKSSGLRVRISGEQLRARYVTGPAAAAPLLKARLVPTGSGTRVVGQVHWAAPMIYHRMYLVALWGMALALLVAGLVEHAWQAEAIAVPLLAFALWLVISDVRERDSDGDSWKVLFERGLLDAFAPR